jgi:Adenylate kinase and related kinases
MIGGPGSGKSTYSEIISKKLNIPHVYTGDMMRKLAQQDTPDGKK